MGGPGAGGAYQSLPDSARDAVCNHTLTGRLPAKSRPFAPAQPTLSLPAACHAPHPFPRAPQACPRRSRGAGGGAGHLVAPIRCIPSPNPLLAASLPPPPGRRVQEEARGAGGGAARPVALQQARAPQRAVRRPGGHHSKTPGGGLRRPAGRACQSPAPSAAAAQPPVIPNSSPACCLGGRARPFVWDSTTLTGVPWLGLKTPPLHIPCNPIAAVLHPHLPHTPSCQGPLCGTRPR